jgi:hypothetical protein
MSSKVRLPLGVLAGAGLGFAAAHWSSPAAPAATRAQAAPAGAIAARPVVINSGGRVDEAARRSVIRDVLSEELGSRR